MANKKRGRPPKKKVVAIEEEEPQVQTVTKPVEEIPQLNAEQRIMQEALISELTDNVGLDELKAIEMGEKYISLSKFAKAYKTGEVKNVTEDEKEKIRLQILANTYG